VTDEDRRPPSRRIADQLREQIVQGGLKPGDQLPSERELAALHGAARNTAREAITILRNEGLVDAQHGRGAFVRQRPASLRRGPARYSRVLRRETGLSPFRAELLQQGHQVHSDCTSVKRVRPPEDVAERLGVSPKAKTVVERENWYFAEDTPVQVGWTYIPVGIAAGSVLARNAELGTGSIYARLEDQGYPLASIREEIAARMPTPAEAKGLATSPGVPVIELLHTSFDPDAVAFEVTRFVMRADVMALDYTVPIEQ
jgi:GntR family transcriptional regulator